VLVVFVVLAKVLLRSRMVIVPYIMASLVITTLRTSHRSQLTFMLAWSMVDLRPIFRQ
jgi:hypothetical protein